MKQNRVLMCRPNHFQVLYEINPWMNLRRKPDPKKAAEQWNTYYSLLKDQFKVEIELIEPVKNLPDMVFTANAGLVAPLTVMARNSEGATQQSKADFPSPAARPPKEVGRPVRTDLASFVAGNDNEKSKEQKRGIFIRSNFRHPERAKEEPYYDRWFRGKGYELKKIEKPLCFEGEGDALFFGDEFYTGYHFRSDVESHDRISGILQVPYFALELRDKRFYHLDTCFAPLNNESALIYLEAFEPYAQMVLLENVKDPIRVSEEEALNFACNALVCGKDVVMPINCPETGKQLKARGFQVYELDFSEFIKAGGAAKCLVLWLEKEGNK